MQCHLCAFAPLRENVPTLLRAATPPRLRVRPLSYTPPRAPWCSQALFPIVGCTCPIERGPPLPQGDTRKRGCVTFSGPSPWAAWENHPDTPVTFVPVPSGLEGPSSGRSQRRRGTEKMQSVQCLHPTVIPAKAGTQSGPPCASALLPEDDARPGVTFAPSRLCVTPSPGCAPAAPGKIMNCQRPFAC